LITGPHVDQGSRDRLDDFSLVDVDVIGSAGAMHAEAVTPS
jgi:hypothetical protein